MAGEEILIIILIIIVGVAVGVGIAISLHNKNTILPLGPTGPTGKSFLIYGDTGSVGHTGDTGPHVLEVLFGPTGPRGSNSFTGPAGKSFIPRLQTGTVIFSTIDLGGDYASGACDLYTYEDQLAIAHFRGDLEILGISSPLRASFVNYEPIGVNLGVYSNVFVPDVGALITVSVSIESPYFVFNLPFAITGFDSFNGVSQNSVPDGIFFMNILFILKAI